jgi:mono/diheme cytochrome c family protein
MDQKFSLSIILTIGAFAITIYLFVVIAIAVNDLPAEPAISKVATLNDPEQEQETIHPGEKIFKANCRQCHRIHQKLVGPALAGVLDRRDSLWVISVIRNSSQLIASGDPAAVEVFREFNGTVMTSFTSFSDEELKALLEYIRIETEKEITVVASSRVEV